MSIWMRAPPLAQPAPAPNNDDVVTAEAATGCPYTRLGELAALVVGARNAWVASSVDTERKRRDLVEAQKAFGREVKSYGIEVRIEGCDPGPAPEDEA
jgi:hypothetical protein